MAPALDVAEEDESKPEPPAAGSEPVNASAAQEQTEKPDQDERQSVKVPNEVPEASTETKPTDSGSGNAGGSAVSNVTERPTTETNGAENITAPDEDKSPPTEDESKDKQSESRGDETVKDLTVDTSKQNDQADSFKTPPTSPLSPKSKDHRRNFSSNSIREHHRRRSSLNAGGPGQSPGSANSTGVSEWSHQALAPRVEENISEEEEVEWQDMPAYAPYDIYDDNNKLIAREHEIEAGGGSDGYFGSNLGGPKGYTKVLVDEDAQSTTSMDNDTAYLFKERGTHLDEEDDEGRDPLEQMQATKNILDDNQRIAYVGVVRLAMVEIMKDLSSIERTKANRKHLDMAIQSMKLWSQKMMVRLYSHMEINSAEQLMIEQLAEHGLLAKDLTPSLMQNARIKNPNAGEAKPDDQTDKVTNDEKAETSEEKLHSNDERPSTQQGSESAQEPPSTKTSVEDTSQEPSESDAPPPPYEENSTVPQAQIPSQLPSTNKLDIDIRWTVLCDLFLILILDSVYDARSRVLLEKVGSSLDVPWLDICRFEKRVTEALEMQESADKENWDEKEHMEHRAKMAKRRRLMFMGLATVGGGLVIGLSAGLLAPVIGAGLAAGFTTIGVSGTSTVLASTGAAAVIGTGGALTGGTVGVRAANRRTGTVKTFEYRPLHNNKRLNLIVSVAGWMTGKVDDVRLPFSTVNPVMGDMYSIHFEPEMLTSMGATINILATEALTQGLQQLLGSTILIPLMAALQVPIILTKLSYLIDNPWSTSCARADQAGLILADSLLDRNLGARPITLVGFSLGSRVIFEALKELANKGAIGIIQNVYIFGSPVVVKKDEWLRIRTIVSGRFVNGYSTTDWILGYLFRATGGGISRVAGLAKVDIPGIENFDVTEHVNGHMAYRKAMPRVLQEVGWQVDSLEFTEIEDPDPDNHERRQRELLSEIEEARKELQEKPEKRSFWMLRKNKKRAQKKAWETYDERQIGVDEEKDPAAGADPNGALFDLEALRKEVVELSTQGVEVKELESTMPPMKLSLNPAETNNTGRPSLSESKSYDSSVTSLNGYKEHPASRSLVTASTDNAAEAKPDNEEGVTMTFGPPLPTLPRDTSPRHSPAPSPALTEETRSRPSFTERARSYMSSPNMSRSPSPKKNASPSRLSISQAPSVSATSVQHIPMQNGRESAEPNQPHHTRNSSSLSQVDVSIDHNVWADEDDPDFGKERDIQMTFA